MNACDECVVLRCEIQSTLGGQWCAPSISHPLRSLRYGFSSLILHLSHQSFGVNALVLHKSQHLVVNQAISNFSHMSGRPSSLGGLPLASGDSASSKSSKTRNYGFGQVPLHSTIAAGVCESPAIQVCKKLCYDVPAATGTAASGLQNCAGRAWTWLGGS